MMMDVYGIGNPLMDVLVAAGDEDLKQLGLHKGTMHLVDLQEREKLLKYIDDKDVTYSCGGACPNTIITLSALGLKTCLAGKVGQDTFGDTYLEQLKLNNVLSNLIQGEGTTGSSIILVSPDSERTMNTYLGINQQFSEEDVNENSLRDAKYLYFTGYMWDTETQKAAILKALHIAKKENIRIAFDVADPFAVNRYKKDFLDLIEQHADIVLANKEESRLLFDEDNELKALKTLSAMCDIAIVKNGAKGSLAAEGAEVYQIPAFTAKTIDTTGAGDTYAAGILFGLAKKWKLEDSALYASYLASQMVTQWGAQFSKEKIQSIQAAACQKNWK